MEPITRIQEVLSVKGITLYRLSKMTGLAPMTINDVFGGHCNPTLKVLTTICTALDMELIIKPVKHTKH